MRIVHALLIAVTSLSCPLRAQIEIATVFADPAYHRMGDKLTAIGDGDGDGVPDFVVYSRHYAPGFGDGRLQLISGASLTVLGQIVEPSLLFAQRILCGADDMNLDWPSPP